MPSPIGFYVARRPCARAPIILLGAVLLALAACTPADPSRPSDTALSCQQINAEIVELGRRGTTSEAKAKQLRPGYYAYQAVAMAPFVGDALGLVEMVADISGGDELDRLNAATETAQMRAIYLTKMQTTRCAASLPADATTIPAAGSGAVSTPTGNPAQPH